MAGFRSREEAEAALAEAMAALGGGDCRTVAGYLELVWLPARRGAIDRSTFDQYAWAARRHIVPALGHRRLAELQTDVLDPWLRGLGRAGGSGGRPLSARSVRLIRKVLSMACQDAVERGLLPDNPVRDTAVPAVASSARAGWSSEEASRFLAVADGHRLGPAFHLAVVARLRRGELLGLRWSDVDLDAGRLRVVQQVMVEGGRARLKPVPDRDRRTVALPPSLLETLVQHQRRDGEPGFEGARPDGDDLVFRGPDGGWLTPERFTRVMDDLIGESQVPRITPNGLRRVGEVLAPGWPGAWREQTAGGSGSS